MRNHPSREQFVLADVGQEQSKFCPEKIQIQESKKKECELNFNATYPRQ
jgi:hypothetical protein